MKSEKMMSNLRKLQLFMSLPSWARSGAIFLFTAFLMFPTSFPAFADETIVDDFEDVSDWKANTAPDTNLDIAQDQGRDGMAMRLDFDFRGNRGFVIARKQLSMPLPENYAFTFYVRGNAPPNILEFKLIDPSGQNVWRAVQPHFQASDEWQKVTIKARHIHFAWGASSEPLREVGAIEFALATGEGGKGSLWIDGLAFEEQEVTDLFVLPIQVRSSTSVEGRTAEMAVDGYPTSSWKSGSVAEDQWYMIDFQKPTEFGGLIIDWDPVDYAEAYGVEISDDAQEWEEVYTVDFNNGGRDYVYLPDMDLRYIRLNLRKSSRGEGYGIRSITVQPYHFSSSLSRFFEAIAQNSPPGAFPRYFLGEQSYWTVVGVAGDTKKALINQDGMVEVDRETFSIEPFLYVGGELLTWHDVEASQHLSEGYLPIPSVEWRSGPIRLRVTALAAGEPGHSVLLLKYAITNEGPEKQIGSLFLALRPFQVTPPWQSLNITGGPAVIRDIAFDGTSVWVNDEKRVMSLTAPSGFGAARFSEGTITDFLQSGNLPGKVSVSDTFAKASGALEYRLEFDPGSTREVVVMVPLHSSRQTDLPTLSRDGQDELAEGEAIRLWNKSYDQTAERWRILLNRVSFDLPASARELIDVVRANLAYILINADGPALQPGPRAYERSWIRDGAFTSAALLRMGFPEEVRAYARWYATYQYPDGKIPCCVDRLGADSVPENDSNGQWLYTLAQYYRFSRDIGFLSEMWPSILKTVAYIEVLRNQRLTPEYELPENIVFRGLVPESISHEGYSSRPVHSYWDNLFVLLGLKEAAYMAQALGETEHAARFRELSEEFRSDLYTSVRHSMAMHGIDFFPGAAELGDFDFTATTIAVDPVGELRHLALEPFNRALEMYLENFDRRNNEEAPAGNYTPYEIRIVGTLIRLGMQSRAHELLQYFLTGQRPAAWNHWAEIVWHDYNDPRFIGDMPHTWIGAEFIRAIRSLFAYERLSDQSLVVAPGVPEAWVRSPEGVQIKRFPTYHGTLNYSLRLVDDGHVRLDMSGDIVVPPGGIVVISPRDAPLRNVTVNGTPVDTSTASEVTVKEFPAQVVLAY
jgi:hypothetical protein